MKKNYIITLLTFALTLSSIAWADGMIALEADRLTVSPGETGWFTAFDWSMSA